MGNYNLKDGKIKSYKYFFYKTCGYGYQKVLKDPMITAHLFLYRFSQNGFYLGPIKNYFFLDYGLIFGNNMFIF